MKKWLAIFMAAVVLAFSSSVAFSADISDFNFKPASEIAFLSNVLPQFNQGDGVYKIPVELDSLSLSSRNVYNNVLSFYEATANTGYFYFYENMVALII